MAYTSFSVARALAEASTHHVSITSGRAVLSIPPVLALAALRPAEVTSTHALAMRPAHTMAAAVHISITSYRATLAAGRHVPSRMACAAVGRDRQTRICTLIATITSVPAAAHTNTVSLATHAAPAAVDS